MLGLSGSSVQCVEALNRSWIWNKQTKLTLWFCHTWRAQRQQWPSWRIPHQTMTLARMVGIVWLIWNPMVELVLVGCKLKSNVDKRISIPSYNIKQPRHSWCDFFAFFASNLNWNLHGLIRTREKPHNQIRRTTSPTLTASPLNMSYRHTPSGFVASDELISWKWENYYNCNLLKTPVSVSELSRCQWAMACGQIWLELWKKTLETLAHHQS